MRHSSSQKNSKATCTHALVRRLSQHVYCRSEILPAYRHERQWEHNCIFMRRGASAIVTSLVVCRGDRPAPPKAVGDRPLSPDRSARSPALRRSSARGRLEPRGTLLVERALGSALGVAMQCGLALELSKKQWIRSTAPRPWSSLRPKGSRVRGVAPSLRSFSITWKTGSNNPKIWV